MDLNPSYSVIEALARPKSVISSANCITDNCDTYSGYDKDVARAGRKVVSLSIFNLVYGNEVNLSEGSTCRTR